ncbi:hypothetical protein ACHQM5_009405 [Ranunculus cassubicifolius]
MELDLIVSSYEARLNEKNSMDQLPLIRDAVKQDDTSSKSQFLAVAAFLDDPAKGEEQEEDAHAESDVNKNDFIFDDNEDFDAVSDGEYKSDEEVDLFDTVCAFCDNGGDLLCCEGRCIRSFHATKDDGVESHCTSLGFSVTQLKAMPTFLCPNCENNMHQCFVCRKLGSSDKASGAEVFQCVTATCGYFYHPECVARLLHPTDEAEVDELKKKISAGESFSCPAHKCRVCKQGENKNIPELQFAVCRRCPKSYHRKCLPRKIVFDDAEDEDVLARAWPNILPCNRVLIYCLSHKIDKFLRTPVRDHILFPHVEDKKTKLEQLVAKKRAAVERKSIYIDDWVSERSKKAPKYALSRDVKDNLNEKFSSAKPRMADTSGKISRESLEKTPAVDKRRVSIREETFNWPQSFKSKEKKVISRQYEGISSGAPAPTEQATYKLDFEAKNRIITIMKKAESLVSVEEIKAGHKVPLTYSNSWKAVVDKTITLGKVEDVVKAVRAAVQKLDAGESVEDAKAVCGPELVKQLIGWKNKLAVYLAPFLHGNRYTSFGRHFTKVHKLQEIVDKLHWYTKNGDTIVDFCCGANDFSQIMKDKLEETGKSCHFRNFDIIHPKNDFCFEKRDWMTVDTNELPAGDNLIMGLNPPFGPANQLIDKALEFRPKLVILIVPPGVQRLDRKKKIRYDLIWEDTERLAGKSFYLPGSVDVNDNQIEQRNNVAPPLSLWSRSDWTNRHKKIAVNRGHVSIEQRHSGAHENYHPGRMSGHFNNEEGPRNYQPAPSDLGVEARQYQPGPSASSMDARQYQPIPSASGMQPPRHYDRSNPPGQNAGFGGGSSFCSTSNQVSGQDVGFGGGALYGLHDSAPPPESSYARWVPNQDAVFGNLGSLPSAPYQQFPGYDSRRNWNAAPLDEQNRYGFAPRPPGSRPFQ